MLKKLKIIFENADVRKKVFLTVGFVILFRLFCYIPVPFVDSSTLVSIRDNGLLTMVDTFSGGALKNFTIMATGVSSYITASIVIQLLSYSFQTLHDISKAPGGQKTIKKYTIILGVILSFFSSMATTYVMQTTYGIMTDTTWIAYVVIAILHTIGTGIAIYIGETITERGVGNGISLLIFVNIISNLPNTFISMYNNVKSGTMDYLTLGIIIVVILVIFIMIVISEISQRNIKLIYSKSAKLAGSNFKNNSSLPIKINVSGVMPIIFASTFAQILSFTGTIFKDSEYGKFLNTYFTQGSILFILFTCVMIFAFTYFYTALLMNPKEIAKNIQTNNGSIPGVKSGQPTAEYILKVIKNMTFIGAIYLSIIALIPMIIFSAIGFNAIASTSLMILVGVSLETNKKLDSLIGLKTIKTF